MRNPPDLERQTLLIAEEDRTVVEDVEVRRDERIRLSFGRVEPGRDPAPASIGEDRDLHGMLEPAGDVHKDTGRANESPAVIEPTIGDHRGESIDVVAHDDMAAVPVLTRHVALAVFSQVKGFPEPSSARKFKTFFA